MQLLLKMGGVLGAALASLLTAPAYAVHISVVPDAAPRKVVVTARRLDGAGTVSSETRAPGDVALSLDAAGTWEVTVTGEGLWTAPIVARGDQLPSITMYQTGDLRGTFEAGSEIQPTTIKVLASPAEPSAGRPAADIACKITGKEWSCAVPAGLNDIRLTAKTYVPHYWWSVRVPPNKDVDLGGLSMRHGASVVGNVVVRGVRDTRMKDVRVTIVHSNSVPGATASSQVMTPNERGFFQFSGVPAGEYLLTARAKKLASSTVRVRVLENLTAELREPLSLEPPRKITFAIAPPLDPHGRQWRVAVSKKREGSLSQYDARFQSQAGTDGVWESASLSDGTYLVTVGDADASWATTTVQISGNDLVRAITVHEQPVRGTVRFGDHPIAAALRFGGRNALVGEELQSGDDGKFAGVVPQQSGTWRGYVSSPALGVERTVEVPAQDADQLMDLDIVLPRTILTGRVLKGDGTPAVNSIIDVRSVEQDSFEQLRPESSEFQVAGVPAGRYLLTANGYMASSDPVEVEIGEQDNGPIELKLKSKVHIRGRVVSHGIPIAGAQVVTAPVTSGSQGTATFYTSDELGRFDVLFPAGTETFDLLVSPPGFPAQLQRLPVTADESKILQVNCEQNAGSLLTEAPPGTYVVLQHEGASWPLSLIVAAARDTRTETDGKMVATTVMLEPGAYVACAASQCVSTFVPPHGTATVRPH